MSVTMEPEVAEHVGEDALGHLDQEWEVPCDIPRVTAETGKGYPKCHGHRAEWIMWRDSCCTESPRHLLICHDCKKTFQSWMAHAASLSCGWCGAETRPVTFTPLRGSS
jgi:hypothetical protein